MDTQVVSVRLGDLITSSPRKHNNATLQFCAVAVFYSTSERIRLAVHNDCMDPIFLDDDPFSREKGVDLRALPVYMTNEERMMLVTTARSIEHAQSGREAWEQNYPVAAGASMCWATLHSAIGYSDLEPIEPQGMSRRSVELFAMLVSRLRPRSSTDKRVWDLLPPDTRGRLCQVDLSVKPDAYIARFPGFEVASALEMAAYECMWAVHVFAPTSCASTESAEQVVGKLAVTTLRVERVLRFKRACMAGRRTVSAWLDIAAEKHANPANPTQRHRR
jgi:hypothetical protein